MCGGIYEEDLLETGETPETKSTEKGSSVYLESRNRVLKYYEVVDKEKEPEYIYPGKDCQV